ncbi:hypothetical protein OB13_07660 [Pontibacter sp. HJ8]
MEDFKLIFYILAIVAYFIFTAWRKAFKTPNDQAPPQQNPQRERPVPRAMPSPTPEHRQHRPATPATSFEDILREMQSKMEKANQEGRQPAEKVKPEYTPASRPVSYETAPPRVLSLEVPEDARLYDQKVKARREDSLDRLPKPRFEKPKANVYAEMLHNPQSIRQAFILTEIFNRKQY